MTERTIKLRGKYWFELRYAAKLLGTSKTVLETLAIRRKIKSKDVEGATYVAEEQVTALRRDPGAWKALKSEAKLPKAPERPQIGGQHQRHRDQDVLPMADYRLQLGPGMKLRD